MNLGPEDNLWHGDVSYKYLNEFCLNSLDELLAMNPFSSLLIKFADLQRTFCFRFQFTFASHIHRFYFTDNCSDTLWGTSTQVTEIFQEYVRHYVHEFALKISHVNTPTTTLSENSFRSSSFNKENSLAIFVLSKSPSVIFLIISSAIPSDVSSVIIAEFLATFGLKILRLILL